VDPDNARGSKLGFAFSKGGFSIPLRRSRLDKFCFSLADSDAFPDGGILVWGSIFGWSPVYLGWFFKGPVFAGRFLFYFRCLG